MTPRARGLLLAAALAAPALAGLAYTAAGSVGLVGVGATGFDLSRIGRVLGERATWEGLWWTLRVALAATMLATAAAIGVALAFRASAPGARAAQALALVPLPVPQVVAAALGAFVLGQSGYVARLAAAAGLIAEPSGMPALVYDRAGAGLTLVLAWKEFPFLAMVAFSILALRGAQLEEAARTLGATPRQALVRITGPLLLRGLLPAVIAVFILQAGAYEAVALFAPSRPVPFTLLTWERYQDPDLARRADAFVLGFVGLCLGLAAVVAHEWARTRWDADA